MHVESRAERTVQNTNCGHLTLRLKIQGEGKISIVIHATKNWKVRVSDIINQEWPENIQQVLARGPHPPILLEMQKWHKAREKYITYHRGRPFDFQTLESNWASPREDEIMPGKLLPQTQHWTAQTILTLGDHCLAQDWDYQHGDAHQDYHTKSGCSPRSCW